jgi:hypothetical protein
MVCVLLYESKLVLDMCFLCNQSLQQCSFQDLSYERVAEQVLTTRGKRGQKHYTVFICHLQESVKEAYTPQLNHEHSVWQWMSISDLRARKDLHPVVHMVLHDHWDKVQNILPGS